MTKKYAENEKLRMSFNSTIEVFRTIFRAGKTQEVRVYRYARKMRRSHRDTERKRFPRRGTQQTSGQIKWQTHWSKQRTKL